MRESTQNDRELLPCRELDSGGHMYRPLSWSRTVVNSQCLR